MKIVKSLEESNLLMKDVSEVIKNWILNKLSGTLGAGLLGNLLTCKGVKTKIPRREVIRADEGTTRAAQDF